MEEERVKEGSSVLWQGGSERDSEKRRGRRRKEEVEAIKGETLGERLRLFLKWEGMTIKELAERSGLSERTIQNYILFKERSPIASNLEVIAKVIPINLHWLITGEGDPYFPPKEKREEKVELDEKGLQALSENEFMLYSIERVLSEPLERRYVKLLELTGKRHGLSFLFSPQFLEAHKKPEKVLESVKDIVEAYEEIAFFLKKIKEKLPI